MSGRRAVWSLSSLTTRGDPRGLSWPKSQFALACVTRSRSWNKTQLELAKNLAAIGTATLAANSRSTAACYSISRAAILVGTKMSQGTLFAGRYFLPVKWHDIINQRWCVGLWIKRLWIKWAKILTYMIEVPVTCSSKVECSPQQQDISPPQTVLSKSNKRCLVYFDAIAVQLCSSPFPIATHNFPSGLNSGIIDI